MFEIVDDDDGRTPDHGYTIMVSLPSGELKRSGDIGFTDAQGQPTP